MAFNIFDLSLKLNQYPIAKARARLAEIQAIQEDNFKTYHEQSKQKIVDYHLTNNHFYKEFVGFNNKSWEDLPVLTKRSLQCPLAERISQKYRIKDVYVNKTSGSSGDPFVFAKDKFCHAMTWAVIQDRFSWFGLDFNSSKQARFYGIPLDFGGNYKERVKDALSNRYRFSVFDLSDNAFDVIVKKFDKTEFRYINGYTSAIVQFAKYLQKRNILLNTVCPSLKYCIVTSEMLLEDDKKLMQHWFGIPIINEYGASELDLIAFENTEQEWQLNSETLYVEILNDDGKILPNGQEGRIVITSLFNKAHPFIRYDIGDIGVIEEGSTPKHQVLKRLVGRTNDIIVLPSGKKAAGLTFYYITKKIIEDDGNVKEFVIEQSKKDTFIVIFTSDSEITTEKKDSIRKEMQNYLEHGLNIKFERRSKIKRSESGKLKQFISKIKE